MHARLAAAQEPTDAGPDAQTSITQSSGESLLIETTALAVLAWLDDAEFSGNVERAMLWMAARCRDGGFGATQSTVLALKAIVAYDASRARPRAAGRLVLLVDGRECSRAEFTMESKGALELGGLAAALTPGRHTIALRMEDGSPMPYAVSIAYCADTPADDNACPLALTTALSSLRVNEGDPVDITATVKNTSADAVPMTMAVIGLPGGLEPRHEQLKELVKAGKFAFYEIRGREVALYFRGLAPGESRDVTLSTIARVPGVTTAPASRAYLYYTPESKRWCAGLTSILHLSMGVG